MEGFDHEASSTSPSQKKKQEVDQSWLGNFENALSVGIFGNFEYLATFW